MIKSIGRLTLALILLVVIFAWPQSSLAQDANTVARILAAVNSARVANGLAPYALSPLLTLSAQRHSEYQASIGQFTHSSADGGLTLQRALAVGYPAIRANENVYAGNTTPEVAVNWWLTADAAHRNNVLHPSMREIGIGAAADASGTIYYTMDISAQPNVLPIFINSDAYSTSDPNVIVTLTNEDIFSGGAGQIGRASQVLISNSADFAGAAPQGWAQAIRWTLDTSGGAGQKTVYVRYIDSAGRTADSQDSIVLDSAGAAIQPPPPQPTPLPPLPTAAPSISLPQPAAPQPTAVPSLPPTATPALAVAQHPAMPTLDFSNSLYMRAQRGEVVAPSSSEPSQPPDTLPPIAVRPILWAAFFVSLLAVAMGSLRLMAFRRSTRIHKETANDGDS